jgi:hypothetical protein
MDLNEVDVDKTYLEEGIYPQNHEISFLSLSQRCSIGTKDLSVSSALVTHTANCGDYKDYCRLGCTNILLFNDAVTVSTTKR